jgi:hypothetical protein
MDPYLEAYWSDVHVKLIGFVGEALTPLLPPALRARSEERILVEEETERREYRSDVAVVRSNRARGKSAALGGAIQVPEPFVIELRDSPEVERSVKIIDVRNGNRLVTAIEILSPKNKAAGRRNEEYQRKLEDYGAAGVSVVEIDLLRSSRRRLTVTEMHLPIEGRTPYMVCVQKGWMPGRWEAYPIGLRAPIPPIRVPLRRRDEEIVFKLQPVMDRVYAASGYDDIDYSIPPIPPLRPDDERWADELFRKAKLRPSVKRPKK